MTERMSALGLLVGAGVAQEALARFHADWHGEALVCDKWFAAQAATNISVLDANVIS